MKKSTKRQERPPLPQIDEEMRQLCALLCTELKDWPNVTSRHMFGMLSFYRDLPDFPQPKIFACIPEKRALSSARSIAFKLEKPTRAQLERMKAERRMATHVDAANTKWFEFSISATADVGEALWWLEQAYQASNRK